VRVCEHRLDGLARAQHMPLTTRRLDQIRGGRIPQRGEQQGDEQRARTKQHADQ